jgi:putative endonuclease
MASDDRIAARIALGRAGEELAAAHLSSLQLAIIARNVRTRHGEIDLIARDDDTLIFVEVKTRTLPDAEFARPSARQRTRLRRSALAWLAQRPRAGAPFARELRFDLVAVLIGAEHGSPIIEHLPGAL